MPCALKVLAFQQGSDPEPDANRSDQGDLQEADGSFGMVLESAVGWCGAQKG